MLSEDRPIFTKKKMSPLKIFLILFFSMFLVAGVVLGVFFYKFSKKHPETLEVLTGVEKAMFKPGDTAFKNQDSLIILILGLDENRDEKGILHHKGSRTDTIILLRVDKNAKRLGVLSIPRDTWINISDERGYDKINTAYSNAFLDEYSRNNHNYEKACKVGMIRARETVERFLGIKIDYTVLVDIRAAKELIDAVGGVTIDVEKDMDYDDNWGNLHIHLKKGVQRLNGNDAVGYGRFRHDAEGDWGRMKRQQKVINALVAEMKNPMVIARIEEIAQAIKKNVRTNMDIHTLVDLAYVYKNFDKDCIIRGIITGTDDRDPKGLAIIKPDEKEKGRLVARILKDPGELKPAELNLQILNSTDEAGLAKRVAEKLTKKGYNVTFVGNADEKERVEMTSIVDYYRNEKARQELEKDLGNIRARVIKKKIPVEGKYDFTIYLGKDFPHQLLAPTPTENVRLPELEPSETPHTSSPEYPKEPSFSEIQEL